VSQPAGLRQVCADGGVLQKKLSQNTFSTLEDRENFTQSGTGVEECQAGDMLITGRLYEDRGHTIVAAIDWLT
jgi:hypothetical protein